MFLPHLHDVLRHWGGASFPLGTPMRSIRIAVRWLSSHTGLPVLLVAALLVVVGYRLLKRSTQFAAQVVVVTLVLLAATEVGWIRW